MQYLYSNSTEIGILLVLRANPIYCVGMSIEHEPRGRCARPPLDMFRPEMYNNYISRRLIVGHKKKVN